MFLQKEPESKSLISKLSKVFGNNFYKASTESESESKSESEA